MDVPSGHSLNVRTSCQRAFEASIAPMSVRQRATSLDRRGVGSLSSSKPGAIMNESGAKSYWGSAAEYWCQASGYAAQERKPANALRTMYAPTVFASRQRLAVESQASSALPYTYTTKRPWTFRYAGRVAYRSRMYSRSE